MSKYVLTSTLLLLSCSEVPDIKISCTCDKEYIFFELSNNETSFENQPYCRTDNIIGFINEKKNKFLIKENSDEYLNFLNNETNKKNINWSQSNITANGFNSTGRKVTVDLNRINLNLKTVTTLIYYEPYNSYTGYKQHQEYTCKKVVGI
tara:strand:+ start:147 stop:596 length:450 start_codon:yes stop_codon:yes gene_type:complete